MNMRRGDTRTGSASRRRFAEARESRAYWRPLLAIGLATFLLGAGLSVAVFSPRQSSAKADPQEAYWREKLVKSPALRHWAFDVVPRHENGVRLPEKVYDARLRAKQEEMADDMIRADGIQIALDKALNGGILDVAISVGKGYRIRTGATGR